MVVQTLGADPIPISIPALIMPPECNSIEPEIHRYEIMSIEVPDGKVLSDFVEFNEETITLTVLKTVDLSILYEHVFMSLLAVEMEGRISNFTLNISYETDGPWIDEPMIAPNITCSQVDLSWSFTVPEAAETEQ